MANPNGGSSRKKKPNPKMANVDKILAVAIDLGASAPDPDEVTFTDTKSFEHSLETLKVDVPIEVTDLDGTTQESVLEIRKPGDLLEKGIVANTPTLRKQKLQKDVLHKWHAQLTGNNVRAQNSISALLASNEKADFIALLENVSNTLLDYQSPLNN